MISLYDPLVFNTSPIFYLAKNNSAPHIKNNDSDLKN